jgi:hypothetical protein
MLPPGPAQNCLACKRTVIEHYYFKSSNVEYTRPALAIPKACSPGNRRGFLFWKCKAPGHHLHERCKACGAKWLTRFAGETITVETETGRNT